MSIPILVRILFSSMNRFTSICIQQFRLLGSNLNLSQISSWRHFCIFLAFGSLVKYLNPLLPLPSYLIVRSGLSAESFLKILTRACNPVKKMLLSSCAEDMWRTHPGHITTIFFAVYYCNQERIFLLFSLFLLLIILLLGSNWIDMIF